MKYEKIEDWSEVEWSQEVKARLEWSEVKKWSQVKKARVEWSEEVEARQEWSQEVKKWRMNEKGKNE